MKYAKVVDGVIVQTQPNLEEGYIEVPDEVYAGQVEDGNGGYSDPVRPAAEVLAQNKSAALDAVDQYHARVVQELVGNPTQVEKDTWQLKLATATAIASGATPSAEGQAFLAAAGLATAAAQTAWAASVHGKAAAYASLVGVAERLRNDSKAAITAATTQDELDAAITANRTAAEQAVAAIKAQTGAA